MFPAIPFTRLAVHIMLLFELPDITVDTHLKVAVPPDGRVGYWVGVGPDGTEKVGADGGLSLPLIPTHKTVGCRLTSALLLDMLFTTVYTTVKLLFNTNVGGVITSCM